MALDANSLKDRIVANLGGLKGSDAQKADAEAQLLAIAKAVVDEIVANAEVSVSGSGGTATGYSGYGISDVALDSKGTIS